ncbi:MAG: dTMP kinase [Candidatus Gastranaerophilales bacterium]|nr:dTMP kinase [Candidatus Gastranaerophilales bacterium]
MGKLSKTKHGYDGLLIVIEGTDGSGKSTQIELLKKYLECEAYGVVISEWKSSELIASVIDDAKERNLFNANTFSLMYASDFAFRLENQVLPALQAGFAVLMDRYTYTAYARDVVRGVKPSWVRKLYNYAPAPDMTFYIDIPVKPLLKRIIASKGFDYYESGRDIGLSTDFYESFKIYQAKILEEYGKMVDEYNFIRVDGNKPIEENHEFIKEKVAELLKTNVLK